MALVVVALAGPGCARKRLAERDRQLAVATAVVDAAWAARGESGFDAVDAALESVPDTVASDAALRWRRVRLAVARGLAEDSLDAARLHWADGREEGLACLRDHPSAGGRVRQLLAAGGWGALALPVAPPADPSGSPGGAAGLALPPRCALPIAALTRPSPAVALDDDTRQCALWAAAAWVRSWDAVGPAGAALDLDAVWGLLAAADGVSTACGLAPWTAALAARATGRACGQDLPGTSLLLVTALRAAVTGGCDDTWPLVADLPEDVRLPRDLQPAPPSTPEGRAAERRLHDAR